MLVFPSEHELNRVTAAHFSRIQVLGGDKVRHGRALKNQLSNPLIV